MPYKEAYIQLSEADWITIEPPPPAFDLFLERERILRGGERTKESFFENAKRYGEEHVAEVMNTEFAPYYINKQDNGSIILTTPGYRGSVAEIYNPARSDWPEYRNSKIQRTRAEVEYSAFSTFEKSDELKNARPGDRFIWLSPPPTEYLNRGDVEGLRALGYGFHSFAFLYEVKRDQSGVLYTESRAIRHYLRSADQAELLNEVSYQQFPQGVNPTDIELLSQITKVKKGSWTVEKLLEDINQRYSNTPLHLRIKPPALPELCIDFTSVASSKMNKWLEGIFYLMYFDKGGNHDIIIEEHFRGWENALKELMAGKNIDVEEIGDPQIWALKRLSGRARDLQDTLIGGYMRREYKPTVGGCGVGAGFGDKKRIMTTTYSSMEDGKSFTGKCPVCGIRVESLHVGESCPGCRTQYLCAEGENTLAG